MVIAAALSGTGLTACAPASDTSAAAAAEPPEVPTVAPDAVTPPVSGGIASDVALWHGEAGTVVLGAAGAAGVLAYSPDGRALGRVASVEAAFVDVLPAVALAGERAPLVVVYDAGGATVDAYRLDPRAPSLTRLSSGMIEVDEELTGLCSHVSRLSGTPFVFGVTDAGDIWQWALYDGPDGLAARHVRRIPVGKGAGYCVVDPRNGALYYTAENLGVWRLDAEPESEGVAEPIDLTAPWGGLGDEVKGVALYAAGADGGRLVVSDVDAGALVLYRLPDGTQVGRATIDGVDEPEGMALDAAAGLLAIADEDEENGGADFKLVAWERLADAVGLTPAPAAAVRSGAPPVVVRPTVETEPVNSFGDAADDPAIWVHPEDPSLSLVIGTQKQLGLYVFDMAGRTVQVLADGRMNNVDLRNGFLLGGEPVTLVAASNRSNDSIALYTVDAETRRLVDVADGMIETGLTDPYGLCMYRSAASGETYVYVTDSVDGRMVQWRLADNGAGRVSATKVRAFDVGTQSEGCVADDALGHLYVGEEAVGLWKYAAEPDGGDARTLIDSVEGDRLEADVEGVTLYATGEGRGYLIVSNQGDDNYAVYRREGDNDYVGQFHIVANASLGIDGASETDGLTASSAPLGPGFEQGMLVVQDGRNLSPKERQNFKYVPWGRIAEALSLSP